MPDQKTKQRPVAITAAFLLVLIASFMPWGTIRYHYTPGFMLLMEHPGLANRIISKDDLSNLKLGARPNQKASAWKAGFDIFGMFYPHPQTSAITAAGEDKPRPYLDTLVSLIRKRIWKN